MSQETEALAVRFLDGELTGDEERDALHRIADDEAARSFLRFDLGLRGLVRERADTSVPEGFADRVMGAIEARDASGAAVRPPVGAAERLARWWSDLGRTRTLRWRPARAALAGVALAVVLVGAFALGIVPAGPASLALSGGDSELPPEAAGGPDAGAPVPVAGENEADTVLVRFVFEDSGAGSVAVAGDFTRWEPVPLARRWRDGEPVWSGVVAVPRGEHRYMFVVDGSRWVTDPLATTVRDDGFGNRNAILSL